MQVLRPQNVPQGCLGQKSREVYVITDLNFLVLLKKLNNQKRGAGGWVAIKIFLLPCLRNHIKVCEIITNVAKLC